MERSVAWVKNDARLKHSGCYSNHFIVRARHTGLISKYDCYVTKPVNYSMGIFGVVSVEILDYDCKLPTKEYMINTPLNVLVVEDNPSDYV